MGTIHIDDSYFFHHLYSFESSFPNFDDEHDIRLLARELDGLIYYMENSSAQYPFLLMACMYATRRLVNMDTGTVSNMEKWTRNVKIICGCMSVLRAMNVITLEDEIETLPNQTDAMASLAVAFELVNDVAQFGLGNKAFPIYPEMVMFLINAIPKNVVETEPIVKSSIVSIQTALEQTKKCIKVQPYDAESEPDGNDVVQGYDLLAIAKILKEKAPTFTGGYGVITKMFDHGKNHTSRGTTMLFYNVETLVDSQMPEKKKTTRKTPKRKASSARKSSTKRRKSSTRRRK